MNLVYNMPVVDAKENMAAGPRKKPLNPMVLFLTQLLPLIVFILSGPGFYIIVLQIAAVPVIAMRLRRRRS